MKGFPALVLGAVGLALPTVAGAEDEACGLSPREAFEAVSPSVVSVLAVSIDPFSLPERVVPALGSGIVIDDRGHVLTNAHSVFRSAVLSVTTREGETVEAELVGADPVLDLAVVRLLEAEHPPPAATLGDSDALAVGDEVLAIGHGLGLGQTATAGIVSGLDRVVRRSPMSWLSPLIQTDAAINPGSSGGPLVDRCGRVVAVSSAMLRGPENVGFAIPINTAKAAIPELIESGRVVRAWHGVYGKMVDLRLALLIRVPMVPGFLVETVEPGSPADAIGLQGGTLPIRIGPEEYLLGGDIITEVNGEPLMDLQTVIRIVKELRVGDRVTLEYFRAGEFLRAEVELPERPVLPGDLRAGQMSTEERAR